MFYIKPKVSFFQFLFTFITLTFFASFLSAPQAIYAKTLKTATFAYLDVAQGNAELIQAGSKNILIDTGRGNEYDELQKQLKNLGVKKIQTLIVTHPDADHMESADDVIADYKVKKVILPRINSSTRCYERMLSSISKHNVKKVHPSTGDVIKLAPSCKGTILSVDASSSDKNEASIVMRVTYGSRSFLYMGDATARVENEILSSGQKTSSDIYLLSHHGSDTANGALFVKNALASKYKTAIISVGANNSYGHPEKNIVRRALKYAKNLFRTDQKGCIVAKTNGKKIFFSFQKVTHSHHSSYHHSYSSKSTKSHGSTSVSSSKKYVYITNYGKKYHKNGCRYLRKSKIKIKQKLAKTRGYTPCKICFG